MDLTLTEANQRFQAVLEHLKQEFSAIRAGRANPSLVENISVSVYGEKMKLAELGTISAPQPSLLTIQVWDVSIVQDLVKALQEANLGLNPSFEGQVIRLPIPPLTAERREEFVKLARQKMEHARVELRRIRQYIREGWSKEEVAGKIGQDEFDRRSKILQDLIDKFSFQIEEMVKSKEQELTQLD